MNLKNLVTASIAASLMISSAAFAVGDAPVGARAASATPGMIDKEHGQRKIEKAAALRQQAAAETTAGHTVRAAHLQREADRLEKRGTAQQARGEMMLQQRQNLANKPAAPASGAQP